MEQKMQNTIQATIERGVETWKRINVKHVRDSSYLKRSVIKLNNGEPQKEFTRPDYYRKFFQSTIKWLFDFELSITDVELEGQVMGIRRTFEKDFREYFSDMTGNDDIIELEVCSEFFDDRTINILNDLYQVLEQYKTDNQ